MFRPAWILSQMNSRIKPINSFKDCYNGWYNPNMAYCNYLRRKNNKYYIPKSFQCLENVREYNIQALVNKELHLVTPSMSLFSGIVAFLFCMSIVYERPII